MNRAEFISPIASAPPRVAPSELDRWFKEEVQPHEPSLRAHLHRKFPQLNDLDDVVQESYVRVFRARLNGRLRSIRGFLFTAAPNIVFDLFRHRAIVPMEALTEKTLSSVYSNEADSLESTMLRQELTFLTAALERPPKRCRQILILRRIDGLSHKEIAEKLSISEHTIEKQVGIGLKKCVEFMKRKGVIMP